MCGIVGYIGNDQATPILLNGLEKLEYRGYDSAGVAVYDGKHIQVEKSEGRLKVLADLLDNGKKLPGTIGIGHTRWATHGKPSDINSHPQVSNLGKFAVVHNGIIENYLALKEFLLKNGKTFVSETDTEVVAQLLEYYYQGDVLDAVIKVIGKVEGSYAFGILCEDVPDQIFAVRKKSPLIIGLGKNENFIASDIPAILNKTREIYRLENNEIAVIKNDQVTIYDLDKEVVKKTPCHIDWDISAAEKGGYEHFMFKEIMEQPKAICDTIHPRIQNGRIVLDDVTLTKEEIEQFKKIVIVACGSAYHVGVVAKYVIEKMTRIPVDIDVASEFRYRNPIIDDKVLVIVISQSGETADTLAALQEAKRLGARVLSIVNVVGSAIANESDDVLYTWAGPEISVATTKAYSTQLTVIYLIAIYMADLLGKLSQEEYQMYLKDLNRLPEQIEEILKHKEQLQYLASKYFNAKDIFFIGRNIDYAMSLEGSLKLKEISYIHSEAYAAGELKHGTISLIEDGTLVVALATQDILFEKMMSNVEEVVARGAVVLGLTTEDHKEMEQSATHTFYIPRTNDLMLASLAVIPLQLFAYYVASMKGCDIDKPRNLAKSVTVE
ncbi:MAG: glutamine--fructose-6-phosphate transaminase (isomerizing) [Clostridiales bacterium]|nr:glutamine--fructose-6-phosphate transaminase (isomerizing) [Clostridiales bacterium]